MTWKKYENITALARSVRSHHSKMAAFAQLMRNGRKSDHESYEQEKKSYESAAQKLGDTVGRLVGNLSQKKHDGTGTLKVEHEGPDGKWLIAKKRDYNYPDFEAKRLHFALYPTNPRHAQQFASTARYLREYGPSDECPGAVGVAQVREYPDHLAIDYLQGAFKQKVDEKSVMPRMTADRYWKWREHLLDHLFEKAAKDGAKVSLDISEYRGGANNRKIFEQAAQRHGFAVSLSHAETEITARPQRKRTAE